MPSIYEWATTENLQPEPITLDIWRKLPEDFCRQVEVVNGQAIRCESPARSHQTAARRLANLLESAAERHLTRDRDVCLDVEAAFDVVLWELPGATIRRPDVALFDCAPGGVRPLPASYLKVIVEVVSPVTKRVDTTDKMGEYALAGIPWYWLVRISDNDVTSIDVYVLDHVTTAYRLHRIVEPEGEITTLDVPIRIKIDWESLGELVR